MNDLKSTLLKVENLDYIVRCCVTAALPELGQIRDLLLLARETIRNNQESQEVSLDLMVKVSLALQRIETFSLAYDEGSIDDWVRFSRYDN